MKLLQQFQAVFEGNLYVNQSPKFRDRVDDESVVLGSANRTHGVKHRRGDGSLGPIVPGESAIQDPGFVVARGSLATIQIGVEVKILAKAMIKQIDRVIGDLKRQAEEFRRSNPQAIAVGIVGVNHACSYRSVEGDRVYETGKGRSGAHPIHEAPAAILRLAEAKPVSFGADRRLLSAPILTGLPIWRPPRFDASSVHVCSIVVPGIGSES